MSVMGAKTIFKTNFWSLHLKEREALNQIASMLINGTNYDSLIDFFEHGSNRSVRDYLQLPFWDDVKCTSNPSKGRHTPDREWGGGSPIGVMCVYCAKPIEQWVNGGMTFVLRGEPETVNLDKTVNPCESDDLHALVAFHAPYRKGRSVVTAKTGAQHDLAVAMLSGLLGEQARAVQSRFKGHQPPVGSVVRVERRFVHGGIPYVYVGLRVGDKWYVTGTDAQTPRVFDWPEFEQFIGDHDCYLVIEYKAVPARKGSALESIDNPRDWMNAVFGDENSTPENVDKD